MKAIVKLKKSHLDYPKFNGRIVEKQFDFASGGDYLFKTKEGEKLALSYNEFLPIQRLTFDNVRKDMAVIKKDRIGEGERDGMELKLFGKGTIPKYFKLYDDDDILYYEGMFWDDEWCNNQSELLNWAMSDSGCTAIKVREKGKDKFEYEIS